MESKLRQVIAIVGPTGTGKTALTLALAKHFDIEVIACDSRTVFRHLDIGTAKPTDAERRTVPHHMLDVVEPTEPYTVAQYKQEATKVINEVISRFKLPVVCGGTGLYARALLEGIEIPEIPPQTELRAELNEFAEKNGNEQLHRKLMELDSVTAARLHINDRFRIVRALEVSITAGQPFSQLIRRKKPPFDTCWIGTTYNNSETFRNVLASRIKRQFADGFVDEVRSLYERYGACRSLTQTVNYKEVLDQLCAQQDFELAEQQCLLRNYQLARKQMIWFRANNQIKWLAVDEMSFDQLLSKAVNEIERHQLSHSA